MASRAHPDETACTGSWPITDNPCKDLPRPGHDTCAAHDPDGDKRPAPPDDERRCQATNKWSGEPCRRYRHPGTTVCGPHGAGARQVRRKAAERIAEDEIMTVATDLIGTPVDNPLTELAAVAGRARAWMHALEDRVAALLEATDPGTPVDGEDDAQPQAGVRYPHRAGEQIRGEIQLYERAMDRLGHFLAAYARLNIDDRLASISAKQADAVIDAIEAALTAAGVRDPAQRTLAKQAAAQKLRAAS